MTGQPTAVVTGGARGIGAATSQAFARAGYDVAVLDLKLGDEAAEVVAAARSHGTAVRAIACDVADVADCRRAVADVVTEFGRITVLVNNAGGAFSDYSTFEQTSEQHYDRVLGANLKGTFFMSQSAAPHLRRAAGASIINLGSELVYRGYDLTCAYAAAKGGVVSLTRSMALALAPEVRVNCVAPGPTATSRFKTERWFTDERRLEMPLERFGEPEDVAASILFLASDAARHITGQTLSVNGGVVMP
jgi:NAD(P)-dependent dehydrogenase (short-subunit alcohol dehydrogenase family)